MYTVVAIAGTFDHLHLGHEKFLREAFKFGKKVMIGVTSDEMAGKKIPMGNGQRATKDLQNFNIRKEKLEEYLIKSGFKDRYSVVQIDDVYGPSILKDSNIEALIVTNDTIKGARMVNEKRKSLKLAPLKIITVPFVLSQDNKRIASTKIREGMIDREGKIYRRMFHFNGKIPEKLRQKLKEPQGEVIAGDVNDLMVAGKKLKSVILGIPQRVTPESVLNADSGCTWKSLKISSVNAPSSLTRMTNEKSFPLIISIGDEVTKLCNELNIPIGIGIVDFHVNRKRRHNHIKDLKFNHGDWIVHTVKNPAGTIKNTLVDAIYTAIQTYLKSGKRSAVRVIGEEDLAGLPAILMAPLGSIILYGQPRKGIVVVTVSEELKARLEKLLE